MSCICPFCSYSSRSDNVRRHIQNSHRIETCLNVLSPSGCTFKPVPRKPYVAVSLASEGNPMSIGYCFRCGDIIPHITGGSMAMYSSHICTPARGGKGLPPIPDTSFLNPEPSEPPHSLTSEMPQSLTPLTDEEYWADVLAKLEAIPGVSDRLNLKRKKIVLMMGDAVEVDSKLSPRDLIVQTILLEDVCNALETTIKHAADAEAESQRLFTEYSKLQHDLVHKSELYDRLSTAYNTEIAAARTEIERLKRRLTPHVDTIEHSN